MNWSKLPAALDGLGPWDGRIVAGDDAPAKARVAGLAVRLGFHPVDLGAMAEGGRLTQLPGGALTGMNLVTFG